MIKNGENTYREILSQPQAWQESLQLFQSQQNRLTRFWCNDQIDLVIFSGCGSTYYLSLTAASILQHLTGMVAQAHPASELVLFPEMVLPKNRRIMLVTISRSGETSETLQAIRVFRQKANGKIIALTCNSQSTLAKSTDFTLATDVAQEKSVAQTRSFTSMAILVEAMSALLANKDANSILSPLPAICQRILVEYDELAHSLGQDGHLQRFFFLGASYLYGIASEAMLKMKEMSLTESEAFHTLEFRHGPMSMITNQSLVVGLVSQNTWMEENAVLQQMHSLGGNILLLAEDDIADLSKEYNVVKLKSGVPPWAQVVLYLPFLQLLAYYRALFNKQNPDQPRNLSAVVTLETLNARTPIKHELKGGNSS